MRKNHAACGSGKRRALAALFSAFLLPEVCVSAEPSAALLTESEFFEEVPIVLSVSRLAQPASETPGAVTVLDQETIRASGFRDIPDLFRLAPGFYVSYYRGDQGIVSYHGLTDEFSRRMQVLIDGRSVYMPPIGGVNWSDLPLAIEDIERIEVMRGPSAAAHGANSFLGAINIVTRHPSQDQGGYLSLSKGSKGIEDGLLRYGASHGALDYRASLGYRSDHGFDAVSDIQRISLFNLRADYRLDNLDTLQFQAGWNGGPRGRGWAGDLIDPPREARASAHFVQLRWQRTLAPGHEWSVQLSESFHKTKDTFLTLPLPPPLLGARLPLDDSVTGRRHDLELQHTFSPAENWRMVWGASARRDESSAPLLLPGGEKSRMHRVFGHAEWRINSRLLLNAGAMLEHNDITGSDTSPRVALNYHVFPGHTLRASVSRALRTPMLVEEKINRVLVLGPVTVPRFVSSGDLDPEVILSRELGYLAEFPGLGLSADLKLYRDRIENLIGATRSCANPSLRGYPRDFCNADSATQTGFETRLEYRPGKNTRIIFNQARIISHGDDILDRYSKSAPVDSVSFLATHHFRENLSASLGYYQQGDVEALGHSEPTDFFRRFDVRLAAAFQTGRSRGEVALTIQNLLNDTYVEFRDGNVFDRRSFLTLSLEF